MLSAPFWCLCQKLSLFPLYFNKTLLHKSSERSSLISGPRIEFFSSGGQESHHLSWFSNSLSMGPTGHCVQNSPKARSCRLQESSEEQRALQRWKGSLSVQGYGPCICTSAPSPNSLDKWGVIFASLVIHINCLMFEEHRCEYGIFKMSSQSRLMYKTYFYLSILKFLDVFTYYWSIVDLQCCVSLRFTAKWFRYTHTYHTYKYFSDSFPL